MIPEDQGYEYPENNTLNLLVGMVIGGLVGALAIVGASIWKRYPETN
jgi:hypothetical protein